MTYQSTYLFYEFVKLLEYLNGVLHINVWVSIIQTFQSSEHTQIPLSSDKQGSTAQEILVYHRI